MTTPTPALILFDIDGTLVLTGRAGLRALIAAARRLFGRADGVEAVPVSGRTDRAIVRDVLMAFGIDPTGAAIDELRSAYLAELQVEIKRPVADPSLVLPGVLALLDALAPHPHLHVALLTGNFVRGAEIKLGHFDLWSRFGFGAFGDEHLDRRDLVPVAAARARAAGIAIDDPSRVIVIGDTPLDVDCARAHGASALAVATGVFDRQALVDAGAHLSVETLADLGHDLAWVDDLTRSVASASLA
jgi:phosphoglycolate phosphatase